MDAKKESPEYLLGYLCGQIEAIYNNKNLTDKEKLEKIKTIKNSVDDIMKEQ